MAIAYQSGEIINDKYRITEILGKGGVAITYSAIALETESNVAIKVISLKQLKNWKEIELFQREAEVLAKLDHPAIPQYIDYFTLETEKDKAFYIIQQQASGKSLAQLVANGWRTTEKEVKNIAQQILEILIYLHSLEPPVIHRDIKPNNLIRSEDGKIYLVDFGAVQNTYYNSLMQGSTVVGTYGYMAPEQFRGKALPTTDLYSLGATLLYLLTHRSPAELPHDTLKLDFRNSVDISESFADWLEQILEPDIEDRFNLADTALIELLKSKKKKQRKLVTSFSVITLALGLIVGINSHKWFFLSRLGYFPSGICSDATTIKNYIKQGGKHNIIASKELYDKRTILNCVIDLCSIELDEKEKLVYLLIKNGADVNVKDNNDQTVLFNAISYGENVGIVKLLIENGAEVNTKTDYNRTPLYKAIIHQNFEIAKLLIKSGADVNTSKPLFNASNRGNTDITKLLLEYGADVNIQSGNGETALFSAISQNKFDIAKLLIEYGANVNVSNNGGITPLHRAKSLEIASLLIKHGAKINIRDKYGKTPLYNAIYANRNDVAKLLIKYGAKANIRTTKGRTPLFESVVRRNKELVQLLIDNGADTNYLNYQTIKKIYPYLTNQQYKEIKYFLDNNQFQS